MERHREAAPLTATMARIRSRSVVEVASVALGSLVAATLFVWWTRGFAPDDAYITFRYAANLADGHGWTYNVGRDSANGATSALYVLVLAGLQVVHHGMETNANLVSIVGMTVAGTCSFIVVRRAIGTAGGLLAAGLVVFNPWFPLTRSMESTLLLAVAAAVLAVAFCARRTAPWVQIALGVLMGSMVMARGESAILVVLVVAHVVWQDRKVPWLTVAGTAGVLATWSVAAWAMTGSVVPATLAGKMAQARSGYWGPSTVFLTAWKGPIGGLRLWPWFWFLLAGAVLAVAAAWRRPGARGFVLVVATWGAATMVAVGLVIRVPGYYWYYAPVWFALLLLAATGWGWLLSLIPRPAAAVAIGLVAILVLGGLAHDRSFHGFAYGPYGDAASWIQRNTTPETSVAAAEIGVLGFDSNRPIIDFLGLIDRQAAVDLQAGDLESWLYRTEPDVFVTHQPALLFEQSAMAASGFAEAYTLVAGDRGLWIFERRAPLERDPTGPSIAAPDLFLTTLRAHGVLRGDADVAAIQDLVAVLVARPDLQAAFMVGDTVDVPAFLAWATQAAASTEPDPVTTRLAPHLGAFVAMLERAQAAELGQERFAAPFLDVPA